MPPPKKFVPRQRKHKVLAREARARAQENGHGGPTAATEDSNVTEILPEEVRARNEKKARLREELRASQSSQMSAKKAKRLEKYIETKLRKDESRELYEKLAAKSIDTAQFESSRDLGKGKKRRRAEKQKGLAKHEDEDEDEDDEAADSEPESDPEPDAKPREKKAKEGAEHPKAEAATSRSVTTTPFLSTAAGSSLFGQVPSVGSGLKRPLELGDDGRPVLQKRQKRGGIKSKFLTETVPHAESDGKKNETEFEEWNGFSDEDDGNIEGKEEEGNTEGSDDGDDDDAEDTEDSDEEGRPYMSGFKAWAQQQRNEALGFKPTSNSEVVLNAPKVANFTPRPIEDEPLPIELQPTANTDRKVFNVAVKRSADIEAARIALPIIAEEQQIMEAIHEHDVVVISGGTGSGKTTQVPQFLYEAGYGSPDSATPGMIGVTQPRRVAAVSMAKRVAEELGDHGKAVGYQIRFESTADKKTAIKFMTDGILLRELSEDIVLEKYSAVIVDEAHERSINTDVLIGFLSRVNAMRRHQNQENSKIDASIPPLPPLKLIIMSATLQIEELTQNPTLFPTTPRVISIEGRQYPVTVHFAQKTHHDYVEEAFRKISRGHRKLPPGGFLVFLTGEEEIQRLAKRLRLEINGVNSAIGPKVRISSSEVPYEAEDVDFGGGLDDDYLDDGDEGGDRNGYGADDMDGEDDAEFVADEGEELGTGPLRMNVLPLYSKLPTKDQQKVFLPPPDGCRQVILATNVAETSLTIPGIRYVFDCGRSKERKYNRTSGVQSFEIGWISKASANQRSGRAGRTGPGHCYRLFSSAVYEENFPDFADPEILRMPIEGVVLQLKSMNVPNINSFPFPTPPDRLSLARAEKLLKYICALDPSGKVNEIGRLMSVFPLSPRFAKILMMGHVGDCLHYVIALVAGLSADEIFVRPTSAIPQGSAAKSEEEEARREQDGYVRTQADVKKDEERRRVSELFGKVHRQFCSLDPKSDALKLLQVVGEFSHEPTEAWCRGHFVHYKALREVQKMRRQITSLLQTNLPGQAQLVYQEKLPRPTEQQITLIKQMVAAGFVEHVAIRADASPNPPTELLRKPRRAIDVPYLPLFPLEDNPFVYIHPSSPMAHLAVAECPQYVVYSHLQRSVARLSEADSNGNGNGSGSGNNPKIRMRPLTDISGGQLAALARGTPLISYGKPIKETFVDGHERQCWVVPYIRSEDATGLGWPLPATKVWQRKVPGRGWEVFKKD